MSMNEFLQRLQVNADHLRDFFGSAAMTEEIDAKNTHTVALEDRVMYSATPLGVAEGLAESGAMAAEPSAQDAQNETDIWKRLEDLACLASEPQDAVSSSEEDVTEVVFIDDSVTDAETLLADLLDSPEISPNVEVVTLNANAVEEDSLAQVSATLARYRNLDAVHFVTHGSDSAVQLGDTWLTPDNLNQHATQLTAWGESLSADGDLLFYGCNLAATAEGQSLIDAVGMLTGADIAASNDLTGNSERGGDWDFEFTVGQVETDVVFSALAQADYQGVFATVTVSTTDDIVNGTVTSIADLIADDGGDGISFREAILATNATAGADTINVGAGTFVSAIPSATSDGDASIGDWDIFDDLTIAGNGIASTVFTTSVDHRLFDVQNGATATIQNATLRDSENQSGGAIRVRSGGDLTLIQTLLSGNSTNNNGGAISTSGSLTIVDSTFRNNTAQAGGGGAIYADATSSLSISGSLFENNSSLAAGGAIDTSGTGAIVNSTLSGNASTNESGGIGNSGTLSVTNVTIANSEGNGLDSTGTTTVQNTIITGSTTNDVLGSLSSGGGNLISDNSGSGWIGSDQTNTDPGLLSLADNGGPTQTMALPSGSPAINAGVLSGAPTIDQRHHTRDANVDVGAYEANGVPSANTAPTFFDSPDGIAIPDYGTGGDEVGETIELASGKLLAVGQTDGQLRIARHNPDGTLDTSFNSTGYVVASIGDSSYGYAVEEMADGRFVVAGRTETAGTNEFLVARFTANGKLDTTFDSDGYATYDSPSTIDRFNDVAVQADGTIIAVGTGGNSNEQIAVVKFQNNGTLDTSFGGGDGVVYLTPDVHSEGVGVAIQADGKIVVGGSTHDGTDDWDYVVTRLNANGTVDSAFGSSGTTRMDIAPDRVDNLKAIEVMATGDIVAVGRSIDGTDRQFALVRLDADGDLDTGFGSGGVVRRSILSFADDLGVDSLGSIFVAGTNNEFGTSNSVVIKYDSSGAIDNSFGVNGISGVAVSAGTDFGRDLLRRSDGSLVLTGNGSTSTHLIQLDPSGSLDTTFGADNSLNGTSSYTEGDGSRTALDLDVTIFDEELSATDDFGGSSVSLVRVGGINSDDRFNRVDGGNLFFTGATFQLSGVQTGSYSALLGSLTLTFYPGTTNADVNEILQSIAYRNVNDNPPASVDIQWTFNDGNAGNQGSGGALLATGTTTVNITPINDEQVLATNTGATVTEGSTGNTITSAMLETTDVDNTAAELVYTITNGPTDGTLKLGSVALALNDTFTQADIDAGNVTYDHTTGSAAASDSFDFTVDDGAGTTTSAKFSLTVSSANDAPTFAGNPTGVSIQDFANAGLDSHEHVIVDNSGRFVTIGHSGTTAYIARYNADGSLDASFGNGGFVDSGLTNSSAFRVAEQGDGKLVVAGSVGTDGFIQRFNIDGTLDTTFNGTGTLQYNAGASSAFHAVAIQGDGKIVTSGVVNGDGFLTVRLDSSGVIDATFGSGTQIFFGHGVAYEVLIQDDGKIVVVGNDSDNHAALARYNSDGTLDTTFDGDGLAVSSFGGGDLIRSAALQSDGKIVVGGSGASSLLLLRYNADGSLDTTFAGNGRAAFAFEANQRGDAVAITADGKYLLSGYAGSDAVVARVNADGTLDTSFDGDGLVRIGATGGDDVGNFVAITSDGGFVVAGAADSGQQSFLTRYDSSASLDAGFGAVTTLDGNPQYVVGHPSVVRLDADVQVFDEELSLADDFGGAVLTLQRAGGANSDDAFYRVFGSNLSFSGANLFLSGVQKGSYQISGGTLMFTFDAGVSGADVNEVMQSIGYRNLNNSHPASSIDIEWRFSDGNTGGQGSGGALEAIGHTVVDIISNPDPVVTVDSGPITFIEDSTLVISPNATVTDDSADFNGGTLTVGYSTFPGTFDFLDVQNAGTGIREIGVVGSDVTYNFGSGAVVIGTIGGTGSNGDGGNDLTVTFNVSATVEAVEELVQNITYSNSSQNPTEITRSIEFTLMNGDGRTSSTVARMVTPQRINDAPLLDNSGSNRLPIINEDDSNTSGDTVASLIASSGGDSITDVDSGSVEGIGIYNADSSNGTWEYSTDGGTTWNGFGNPSPSAALLLSAEALIRFEPNTDFNGDATFAYVAWDQTAGTEGGTLGLSGNSGGSGTFSTGIDTALVTVTPENDAPVLDTGATFRASAIQEDATNPTGDTVAAVVASDGIDRITDIDTGAIEGLAIYAVDDSNGTWQYSLDSGGNWLDFGAVSPTSVTLLSTNAMVRFIPNADFEGTARFFYHAWDQTTGSNGETGFDMSANGTGGSTAFSTASDEVTVNINPVDDAPVIDLDANDSSGATGVDFQTSYAAGSGPQPIVDPSDLTLTDIDSSMIQTITVEITNRIDGAAETLDATVTGLPIAESTDPVTGAYTLTGPATVTQFEQVLRTLTYTNHSTTPDTTTRVISIIAHDGTSSSIVATSNVTVTSDSTSPTVANNTGTRVDEGSTNVISRSELSFTDNLQPTSNLTYTVTGIPNNGILAANGDLSTPISSFTQTQIDSGQIVYVHDGSETTSDRFTFVVDDGFGNTTTTQTFNIVVIPINDAPVNGVSSVDGQEDILTLINLNASDPDGTVASFSLIDLPANVTLYTDAARTAPAMTGVDYRASSTGDFRLFISPDANWSGTTTFQYTAKDNLGLIDATPATGTITISPVNDAPATVNDTFTVDEGATLNIGGAGVLENDTDADGDTLSATLINAASNGTITLNTDGSFTYTHDGGEISNDSFAYSVADGNGGTNVAAVAIFVNPVNDAPTATDDTISGLPIGSLTFTSSQLLANDTDIDDDNLIVSIMAQPAGGAVVDNGDGTFTYTPTRPNSSADSTSFTYMATDPSGATSVATATIEFNLIGPSTGGTGGAEEETDEEEEEEEEETDEGESSKGGDGNPTAELPNEEETIAPPPSISTGTSPRESGTGNNSQTVEPPAVVEVTPETTSTSADSPSTVTDISRDDGSLDSSGSQLVSTPIYSGQLVLPTYTGVAETPSTIAGWFDQLTFGEAVVGGTAIASGGLSAGYAIWMVRGGSLLAGLLSSMPAWTSFDPLPILTSFEAEEDEDGESLADIADQDSAPLASMAFQGA